MYSLDFSVEDLLIKLAVLYDLDTIFYSFNQKKNLK